LRSKDQGGQNVAEKNPTKGVARLGFFVAQNAARRFAYTVLLGEVKTCYEAPATDGGHPTTLAGICFYYVFYNLFSNIYSS
jgi:hypothetical protein